MALISESNRVFIIIINDFLIVVKTNCVQMRRKKKVNTSPNKAFEMIWGDVYGLDH